jgi:hypothetical protein
MPRRSGARLRPCDWVADFPDGTVADGAPAGVAELAGVARNIRELVAAGDVTVAGLARDSGVHRTTVHDILAGKVWMDTQTLARLETAAGRRLWGE